MNIEQYILPRPLTNAQAREGIVIMERMAQSHEPRGLRTIRLRTRLFALEWWARQGDLRAMDELEEFMGILTDEDLDLILREDLNPNE